MPTSPPSEPAAGSFRLFRLTRATYEAEPAAVRDRLREAARERDIEVEPGPGALAGRWSAGRVAMAYTWRVRPADGDLPGRTVAVERQAIEEAWYGVAVLAAGALVLAAWLPTWLGVLPLLVAVGLFGYTLATAVVHPSPLAATRRTNEGYLSEPVGHRAATLVIFLSAGVYAGAYFLAAGVGTGTGSLGTIGLLLGGGCAAFIAVALGYVGRRDAETADAVAFDEPGTAGAGRATLTQGYMGLLVLAVLPAGALVYGRFVFIAVLEVPTVAPLLATYGVASVGAASLLNWGVSQSRRYARFNVIEGTEYLGPLRRAFLAAVTVATGLAAMHVLVQLPLRYAAVLGAFWRYPYVTLTLGLVAAPLVYFLAGLGYQVLQLARQLRYVFGRSRRAGPELQSRVEPTVRVLEVNRPEAFSVSTGRRGYVFVSEWYLRFLDDEELTAVLAHEATHAEHTDAALAFAFPLLGVALATGKNVLYSYVDYRAREFRADAGAAAATSPATVDRVLGYLGELDARSGAAPAGPPLAAPGFSGRVDTRRLPEVYWGVLFGGFALAEAHPSVEERRARLAEASEGADPAGRPDTDPTREGAPT